MQVSMCCTVNLRDISKGDLLAELREREARREISVYTIKDAFRTLREQDCPDELLALLEVWEAGHLMLPDVLALTRA